MRVHTRSFLYKLIAGSVLFSSVASHGDIGDFFTELITSEELKEFERGLYGLWVTDAGDAILLQPGQSPVFHDFVFTSSVWPGENPEPLIAGRFDILYSEEDIEQRMSCRVTHGATEELMRFTIGLDRGQLVLTERFGSGRLRFNKRSK
jgi:hypothetical protein